jgi:hypothetical protein
MSNENFRDDEAYEAFIAYARAKPADESYDYTDCEACAYTQFLRDTGRAEKPTVGPGHWSDRAIPVMDRPENPIDGRLGGYHFRGVGSDPLQAGTFGGILERLNV